MTQPSEQIKEKINIVDFLKGYLEMKPAGRNFKANCPFHQEKTPSFIISPDRQIWHCFGCGLGGDIFKFLMTYENIEFYEALKVLADKAGIELKSLSSQDYRQFGVLYEINEATKDFYVEHLSKSSIALQYLKKRSLHENTIAEFELGFAPNDFDATAGYLLKKGYKIDDILRAGIVFKTDKGKYGDRFRGRVMFPIHNHFGKIVGFTGRVLPEYENTDMGKYVNSPETQIFLKSKVMYGFWKTKQAIREANSAVLVEGQMDFLMAWQGGVKNIVASSGTALTADHLKVLKPIADTVVIAYDNDEAGKIATERALDLLGASDFNSLVLDLGAHKDPADAVVSDKDFLPKAIASARSGMQHYFARYIPRMATDRKGSIRAILDKISKLYSQIDQADWLRELSHSTSISEKDLALEMDKVRGESAAYTEPGRAIPTPAPRVGPRSELIALRVLGLLSANRSFYELAKDHIDYFPQNYRLAYQFMAEGVESGIPLEIKQIIDFASLSSADGMFSDSKDPASEFTELLYELQVGHLKSRAEELQDKIRIAEARDNEVPHEIMKEFDVLSKKIQDIRKSKSPKTHKK